MFPIIDLRGDVIGFGGRVLGDGTPKYLNSPDTPVFNKSRNLFALNLAKTTKLGRIVLTEGYMDTISLYQAGFDCAVASLGTALTAMAFGLYEGDEPVGFALFGYGRMEGDPEVARDSYVLCRFMIDQRYQGRGLGKRGLQICLDYLRTYPCGPAKQVWLSYEPDNAAARSLYHRFGFEENGETDGEEIVAVLPLTEAPNS